QDKAVFKSFFGLPPSEAAFDNIQRFDFDSLMGRISSSSYMPGREDARHSALTQRAKEIFDQHQVGGRVAFEYDTRVFYGQMA
ncbi:MAG: SAM-dependent methyltransferase, partial [Betaproteobacteria bacterium]